MGKRPLSPTRHSQLLIVSQKMVVEKSFDIAVVEGLSPRHLVNNEFETDLSVSTEDV